MKLSLSKNDRILFEGDSLTSGLTNGYACLNRWDVSWAQVVENWLFCQRPELWITASRQAVGGSTCREMVERYNNKASSFGATVALFTIGTNDALQKVGTQEFASQLADYIQMLKSTGCRVVVHVGGFLPGPNLVKDAAKQIEACMPYWAVAREVMHDSGGAWLDVGPELLRRAKILVEQWPGHTIYSGGLHYNAVGNQMIAGIVLKELGWL